MNSVATVDFSSSSLIIVPVYTLVLPLPDYVTNTISVTV